MSAIIALPNSVLAHYLAHHDLPYRVSDLERSENSASIRRKIRYRSKQAVARWEEFVNGTSFEVLMTYPRLVITEAGKFHVSTSISEESFSFYNSFDEEIYVDAEVLTERIDSMLPAQLCTFYEPSLRRVRIIPALHMTGIAREMALRAIKTIREDSYSRTEVTALFPHDISPTRGVIPAYRAAQLWSAGTVMADRFRDVYRSAFRDVIRKRMEPERKTHDTSANLVKFLERRERELRPLSGGLLATLPIAEHGTKTSRTWGIEVESGGARGISAPKDWDRKYDGSLVSAYSSGEERYVDPEDCEENDHREYIDAYNEDGEYITEIDNPEYVDPEDCEYCGYVEEVFDYDDGPTSDCGEFVSPILHSFHSRGLELLVEKLATQPQNDSAGVHVHVGADGLTPKQLGGLVFAYQMIEPLIEEDYCRETRGYCHSRTASEVARVMQSARESEGANNPFTSNLNESYLYTGERYVSLNLQALEDHGTVEFRAMGPVYEYEHLIRWAHFCREMVNCAAADVPPHIWAKVKTFEDIRAIFTKYGDETADMVVRSLDYTFSEEEALAEV